MLSISALVALAFSVGQDEIAVRANEPRPPEVVSTSLEIRCGRRLFSLRGVGGDGTRFDAPTAELNRRRVSLPSDVTDFLISERSTYRISGACPDEFPSLQPIQLYIYRAQAASDENISYVVRALDIRDNGRIVDRGNEASTAEAFWFR